jgi:translation initiation factor IF-2
MTKPIKKNQKKKGGKGKEEAEEPKPVETKKQPEPVAQPVEKKETPVEEPVKKVEPKVVEQPPKETQPTQLKVEEKHDQQDKKAKTESKPAEKAAQKTVEPPKVQDKDDGTWISNDGKNKKETKEEDKKKAPEPVQEKKTQPPKKKILDWAKSEDEKVDSAPATETPSGDFPSLGGENKDSKKQNHPKTDAAPKKEQSVTQAPKPTVQPKEEKKKEETPKKETKTQAPIDKKAAPSKPVGNVPVQQENKLLSGWALPGKQKKEPEQKEKKETGYDDDFPSL